MPVFNTQPAQSRGEPTKSFGELLYRCRTARGRTQAQVGAAANLSGAYVSALENLRRPPPPLQTVRQLARALALPPSLESQLAAAADAGRHPRPKVTGEVANLVATLKRGGSQLPTHLVREFQERIRALGKTDPL